jgi:Beta-eliminating lyase
VTDPKAAVTPARSLAERRRLAMPGVERNLTGSRPASPQDELRSITSELDRSDGTTWDRYGEGGPVAALESQVAELLGKPAAVMFPSGTMAQQSTLRVLGDRHRGRRIAIPSLSHLLHHEQDGPRLLNGFEWALLTTGAVVPKVEHLMAIPGPLGAALVELPLRDAGYLLPSWEQLEALSPACRGRGVSLHLDGARIWESAPYLGHSPGTDRFARRHGLRLVLQGPAWGGPARSSQGPRTHRRGAALAQSPRWHAVDDVPVCAVRPSRTT